MTVGIEIFSFLADLDPDSGRELLSIHLSVRNPNEGEVSAFWVKLLLTYGVVMVPVEVVGEDLKRLEVRDNIWTWSMPAGSLLRKGAVLVADPGGYLTHQRIKLPDGTILEPFGPDPSQAFATTFQYRTGVELLSVKSR